jgi:endoglucanase
VATDWRLAAQRGGNAVLSANPNLLVLVEGIDHSSDNFYTWWGGGLADARTSPVVLSAAGHLVYSPHDYPASIYAQPWFSAANYPANLPGVWDHEWGYLAENNIAPVLLGEFGTKLQTTSDKQWLAAMVSYLQRTGISFAYWDYNPNSGDTGGLVADDWRTPETAKLTALKPILGTQTTVPGSNPTPTPTPSPTPKPTPSPTTAPPTTNGSISASWQLQSSWQSGPSDYGYVANIVISSATAHSGWSVSWPDAGAKTIANSWGMACHIGSGRVTCSGADWAANLAAGQPQTVGLQVSDSAAGPAHPALTVSG